MWTSVETTRAALESDVFRSVPSPTTMYCEMPRFVLLPVGSVDNAFPPLDLTLGFRILDHSTRRDGTQPTISATQHSVILDWRTGVNIGWDAARGRRKETSGEREILRCED